MLKPQNASSDVSEVTARKESEKKRVRRPSHGPSLCAPQGDCFEAPKATNRPASLIKAQV